MKRARWKGFDESPTGAQRERTPRIVQDMESALAGIDGGRVLDVATQEGRYVQFLMDSLKSYTEIVGIDINERAIEAARSAIEGEGVSFSTMDAGELEFADESFDTVAICASLHHMPDIARTLGEMRRVLKEGGRFIVAEMHREAGSESELTSTYLHRWAAEIDMARGRLHNAVLSRGEILDHVAALDLRDVEIHDFLDTESDPMEEAKLEKLTEVIGLVTKRAEGSPGHEGFRARGQELIQRLQDVGARGEPVVFVTGIKQTR